MDQNMLRSVLNAHNLWLTSDGKAGEPANLQGAYLYEANLQGADLRKADLREANLQGANLQGANLIDAKFTLEIRDCHSYRMAQVSEVQLPWLVLHPRFGEWMKELRIEYGSRSAVSEERV